MCPALAERSSDIVLPAIGTPFEGGILAAATAMFDGRTRVIITADKSAGGELGCFAWATDYRSVPGAKSFTDSMANTAALDGEQFPAAQACRAYRAGGFDNWCLPSLVDQEAVRLNLCPIWTEIPAFKTGGEQAYEDACYWTSTQSQFGQNYAWRQDFGSGGSDHWGKDNDYRVRPVRILFI
ncbi:DUF1566 domain-containing protein [Telmatospirillum sp.]|uniref:Lcl C-terminal domain-containing protein n=1 Tax=Telmatospirillum sp. TaxID=2079197 RepID=UPI0028459B83|nr:DUF1566 domain-containing protein [Telmatospirillum sp.]MDR3438983.1 DUF1566 domain-containing protein [Telmatospirillum sp.]